MRLRLDLRLSTGETPEAGDSEWAELDLRTLAAKAHSPRQLWRTLRARHYDEVVIVEGDVPFSTIQAIALLMGAVIPAKRFRVGRRVRSRLGFLAVALARLLSAAPRELVQSFQLIVRVSRSASHVAQLPTEVKDLKEALYIRADPTLTWMGLQVGGAATHTTGLINGLIENGVEVEVLSAERPSDVERARFTEVSVRRAFHLVPALQFTEQSRRIAIAARGLRTGFVYQRHQLGSDAGVAIAERNRAPLVLEFNGSDVWIEENWFSGSVRLGRLFSRLESRMLLNASLVVVVSDALRSAVLGVGVPAARILVNPNGVDVDSLARYRRNSASAWRESRAMTEAPTVGFIGTFGPWHGADLLPQIAELLPGTRWIVIGNGPQFKQVADEVRERGLEHRMVLTGLLPREHALELLACCDVCVSPHVPNPDGSEFFGSPTKILEYMGLGKPIVASDLAQIGQILTHERTALLCAPGDVAGFAAAVDRLLSDPQLRQQIADQALAQARATYTWKAHARRILDALQGRPGADWSPVSGLAAD